MMGIEVAGKPLMRAYSIASSQYDDTLEFFSIKVPRGALTSRLQYLKPGDKILVGKKAVGTLLFDNLLPGRRLWLLSTGTGLAPFLSIIRDLEVYERFENVILVHGVRQVAELAYLNFIVNELPVDEFFGRLVRKQMVYYPTVTREPYRNQGRITNLIRSGKLFEDLALPGFNRDIDRFMICGSQGMLDETKVILAERLFAEGSQNCAAHFAIEKAFVEK